MRNEVPLIEMIRFCDEKEYDVQPVREGKFTRFIIWKENAILKIGQKKYKNWKYGQIEAYTKLYNALNK